MLPERIKRRRARRFLKTLLVTGWLSVLSLFFWAIFYSPLFVISDVRVKAEGLNTENITKTIEPLVFGRKYGIFKKNHPLFIDERLLTAKIMESFSQIGEATAKYNFFDHYLEIGIELRKPVAHWCLDLECYLIDRRGIIYGKAGEREGSLILAIRDSARRDVRLGTRVVPEDWMEFFSSVRERLRPIVWVSGVIIEEESFGAHYARLETVDGWYILVDTDMDPIRIADELQVLLAKEIGEKTKKLEYIDLRLPNRAYYKLR